MGSTEATIGVTALDVFFAPRAVPWLRTIRHLVLDLGKKCKVSRMVSLQSAPNQTQLRDTQIHLICFVQVPLPACQCTLSAPAPAPRGGSRSGGERSPHRRPRKSSCKPDHTEDLRDCTNRRAPRQSSCGQNCKGDTGGQPSRAQQWKITPSESCSANRQWQGKQQLLARG